MEVYYGLCMHDDGKSEMETYQLFGTSVSLIPVEFNVEFPFLMLS